MGKQTDTGRQYLMAAEAITPYSKVNWVFMPNLSLRRFGGKKIVSCFSRACQKFEVFHKMTPQIISFCSAHQICQHHHSNL